MHLLIPFASAVSEAAVQVLIDLQLPNLTELTKTLTPTLRDDADEYTLSPPHERALAALWGWRGADGELPFAARTAAFDGVPADDRPRGMLSPAHWHVGRTHVTLVDPGELHLRADESRALLDAVRDLFESEGFDVAWGAADRWYVTHAELDGLATASIDRAIGRDVELWLRGEAAAPAAPRPARHAPVTRLVRRLQSECQLLLYAHPINEAREARGELSVNSFWLSGCGRPQPVDEVPVDLDTSLRAPLLGTDWAAWADAWRTLDSSALAALLGAFRQGQAVALTLCGERSWQRFESAGRGWLRRLRGAWRAAEAHTLLAAL